MKFLIGFILLLTSLVGVSQTGPGGIGETDGSSSLELWLDPDFGISTTGPLVDTWGDQSGNGIDFNSTGTGRPKHSISEINGHDCTTYERALGFQRLNISSAINDIGEWDNRTIIYVYKYTANETDLQIMGTSNGNDVIDYGNTNQNKRVRVRNNGDNVYSGNNSIRRNRWHVGVVTYNGWRTRVHNNGERFVNSWSDAGAWAIDGDFDIGGADSPSDSFDGDIAEVIIFSEALNDAKRIIVENYLAAKYGLNLRENDIYRQDRTNRGNYDFEVGGIGRRNLFSEHSDSQGGMVRISNPSNLGNNEYLFWGHDGGAASATEIIDIPSGLEARFERVWRVSETDPDRNAVDIGSIDMHFDLSGLGSITPEDLNLLVDTDDDGDFADETPIVGATLIGGSTYEFSGVVALSNNTRFTIGTSNVSITPLPIELLSFDAEVGNDNQINLTWETASEINNDFFTIEIATDGFNWQEIAELEGAGTSNEFLSYAYNHSNPPHGILYYRLKQTDFDGQFEYSDVVSVNLENVETNTILIYPNPAVRQISVEGDADELSELRIFNMLGQDVTHLAQIDFMNSSTVQIDLGNLNGKTYVVKTKTTSNILYK